MDRRPFFTIGHSTHGMAEFTALLGEAGVDMVVDVRTVPRSRANPQFNLDAIASSLAASGVGYRHCRALGGLRPRRKDIASSPNGFWRNASFRNYADYANTEPFQAALTELIALGTPRVCAVMCAEALWWRCHRRIIADYLIAAGERVFHLMGRGAIEPAALTVGARLGGDGLLTYPAGPAVEAAPDGRGSSDRA